MQWRNRLSISKPTIRLSRKAVLEQNAFNPERSALQKRLDWVAATLKLETREALALAAVCRLTQLGPFRGLAQALAEYGEERDEVSARVAGTVIGLHGRRLHNIFDRQGQLMQLGLLEDRHGGDFAPSEMLLKLLRQRTTDPRVLEDALIGGPVVSRLSLADFDHLGQARDDVVAILSGCMKQRAEGVGLLFFTAHPERAKPSSPPFLARLARLGLCSPERSAGNTASRSGQTVWRIFHFCPQSDAAPVV